MKRLIVTSVILALTLVSATQGGVAQTSAQEANLGCKQSGIRYVGSIASGRICFTVTSNGTRIRELSMTMPRLRASSAGGSIEISDGEWWRAFGEDGPIVRNGSFKYVSSETVFSGSLMGSNASGTLQWGWTEFMSGIRYDTGTFRWSAHKSGTTSSPPPPAAKPPKAPSEPALAKPVIGPPFTVPVQPVAGKRFTVAFKVTRSDTGAPLTSGTMICDPSTAGNVIPHAESFRGGTARLSFVVPASAKGKLLKVKVTIKVAGKSATKVASFKVQQGLAKPSLAIGDSSVAEGNAGTTALSFPVTLSAAYTEAITVNYATANGTATAPADYTAATGTLSFKPGEKAKTIAVTVVGETAYEPDETLTVALSNPVNATIADGTATGTITNDDTLAMPGPYSGRTSQNETVSFEVLPGGTQVRNFRLSDVNLSCKPPNLVSLHAPNTVLATTPVPINSDATFTIAVLESGVDGTTTWKDDIKVTGRFSGNSASGSYQETFSVDFGWLIVTCTAPNVTWTAARVP